MSKQFHSKDERVLESYDPIRSRVLLGTSSLFRAGAIPSTRCDTEPPASTAHSSHTNRSLPVLSPRARSPLKARSSRSPQRLGSTSSDNRAHTLSINSSVSGPLCRICHEDGTYEQLFSPCYCSGTIGLLHLSCLQSWLGTSNRTVCELCNFQFTLHRKPKSISKYFKNPGTSKDKRQLSFDIVCLSILSPLTFVTSYLCIHGSTYFPPGRIEFIGLVILTVALLTLYSTWLTICIRQNIKKWRKWQQFNQNVKLICRAPECFLDTSPNRPRSGLNSTTLSHSPRSSKTSSVVAIKLQSIQLNISTDKTFIPPTNVSVCQEARGRTMPSRHQQSYVHVEQTQQRDQETIPYMNCQCHHDNVEHVANGIKTLARPSASVPPSTSTTQPTELPSTSEEAEDYEEEIKDMQIKSWVMTTNDFREQYDRTRSTKSSLTGSYNTAAQSLLSASGSDIINKTRKDHAKITVRESHIAPSLVQFTDLPMTEEPHTNPVKTAVPNKHMVPSPVQFADLPVTQEPHTNFAKTAVPDKHISPSPVQFTDLPVAVIQERNACVWTRPLTKETYI